MKTASKIISVALALVLALSVFMLPASAADKGVDINARVTAEQVGTDANGLKIYKMGVYVNSSHSLIAVQMNLTYDNSAFQLLRPNKNNATVVNANMVIDKADTELAMYDGDAYTQYEGAYADGDVNADIGYAMFPQDGTQPSLAKISDTNMGAALKGKGYTGLYWAWMVDTTDNYLLLSGGSTGTQKALAGEVKLLTFYMKEKATAADGSYEIGFNVEQAARLTGTYCTSDKCDSLSVGPDSASITPAMVSYQNATITIGEEAKAPVLTKANSQVKMTATSETTVADAFQFRVISKISSEDWNTYFANTGKDGATENVITSVGFVAYKGTAFDLEAAKAVAQAGKDSGDYAYADTDYICHEDGGVATFGCRINYSAKPENDPTYIAFAKYKDASGADQIVFYAAAETSPLATNYTGIVADYLATFPYAG